MLRILLLSSDPATLALMQASADALKATLDAFSDAADLERKMNRARSDTTTVVALDLARLAVRGRSLATACSLVRKYSPEARIGVICSATHAIDEAVTEWVRQAGADVVVPQINPWRWASSGNELLLALVADDEAVHAASRRVAPYLRAAAQAAANGAEARLIAAMETAGIDLPALALRMQRSGGVNIANRSYRLKIYPECFVASEGVRWIEGALRVATDQAIAIGQALQAAGIIYHVAREQVFADENLFFRVSRLPSRWDIDRFYALIRSSTGVPVLDRSYRGTAYPRCFVGSEAVDWMQAQGHSMNEAMSMGQRLLDLSLVHHVVDEHPFKNDKIFYRFYADE